MSTVSLSSWVTCAALSAPLSADAQRDKGELKLEAELSEQAVEKQTAVHPTWCRNGHAVQLYNIKLELLAVWLFPVATVSHPNTQLGKLIRHQHQQLKYWQRVWEPDRYVLQVKQMATQRGRVRLHDTENVIDLGVRRQMT